MKLARRIRWVFNIIRWFYGVSRMKHMKQNEHDDYIQGKQYGWKKEVVDNE